MSIKVVLFDLDGTLLPMDQDVFVKTYFGLLAKKLSSYGYEPEKLIESVWTGTKAMMKNNGEQSNEEAFWNTFAGLYDEKVKKDIPLFEDFYKHEFSGVKEVCGYNPKAAEAVAGIKELGLRVALATNPLFPKIATENRIRWAGLEPDDFEFYTTYEESRYCKPNPKYYEDILQRLQVRPEECLMVGNDITEDAVAAGKAGMKAYLITKCIINKENKDLSEYPQGDFMQLMEYVKINSK